MDDIEFLICDVAALWRRAFNLHNKQLGISNVERRIIIAVARNSGATQVEIATLLDLVPQNIIKPLDNLIAQGWLEKRLDSRDRRVNRLYLTLSCQPILEQIKRLGDSIRPQIVKHSTPEAIEAVKLDLAQMKLNLERYLQK